MKKQFIIISCLLLIIALTFVIAGTDTQDYVATITGTSNIQINSLDVDFGSCNPSSSCSITNSLTFYNGGNAAPGSGIEAVFTTNVSTGYGLNLSTTDVINGSNFQLNSTALADTYTNTTIMTAASMPALANETVGAQLTVPAGQTAGTYGGTVLISWVS